MRLCLCVCVCVCACGVPTSDSPSSYDDLTFPACHARVRARVNPTQDVAAPRRFSEKAHLLTAYTAVAFAPPARADAGASAAPAVGAKRPRSASLSNGVVDANAVAVATAASNRLVACGTSAGLIVLWDCSRGEVTHRLGAAAAGASSVVAAASASAEKKKGAKPAAAPAAGARHTTAVIGLAWHRDADSGALTLYSCAEGSPTVICWDAVSGKALRTLTIGGARAITRVAVSSDGATLFAAGADVFVCDAASGAMHRRLAGHSVAVTALTLSEDDSILVSAADERNVHVYDVAEAARSGAADVNNSTSIGTAAPAAAPPVLPTQVLLHPNRPLALSLTRPPHRKHTYHIAAVSEDGGACIWRYKRSSRRHSSVSVNGGAGATADAVRKPLPPACAVEVDLSALPAVLRDNKLADKPRILALRLAPGVSDDAAPGPAFLQAVVGPFAAPSFFVTPYTTSAAADGPEEGDGADAAAGGSQRLLPSVKLRLKAPAGAPGAAVEDGVGFPGSAGKSGAARASLEAGGKAPGIAGEHVAIAKSAVVSARGVRDESVSAGPTTSVLNSSQNNSAQRTAGSPANGTRREHDDGGEDANVDDGGADDDGGLTLGQRMQAVIAALRDPGATPLVPRESADAAAAVDVAADVPPPPPAAAGGGTMSAAAALASTGSLASVLQQALHSRDDAALELVLGHQDKTVIGNTVSRLGATYVIPFLTRVVAKFQAKPSRGVQLVGWLRAVLTHHTGYLLTVPHLVASLEALYQIIDSRLAVYKKLLKLSGRLDLLMSQVEAGSSGGAAAGNYSRAIKRARISLSQAELDAQLTLRRGSASGSGGGDGSGEEDAEDEQPDADGELEEEDGEDGEDDNDDEDESGEDDAEGDEDYEDDAEDGEDDDDE